MLVLRHAVRMMVKVRGIAYALHVRFLEAVESRVRPVQILRSFLWMCREDS